MGSSAHSHSSDTMQQQKHQPRKKNSKGSVLKLQSQQGAISKKKKKAKNVSIKNRIRSVERLLKKDLPIEVREAQQKRLTELKEEADRHAVSELERKMAVRYRKVKFFERRKIERRIRRLEKQQRALADELISENSKQGQMVKGQLARLQEDLEYVRFFPKTEKYVSLFMGNENESVVAQRKELRERIKANLAAAAAAGVELEETGSEDDLHLDFSEDEFFLSEKERLDADADDEWTDKSLRLDEPSQKKELPLGSPKQPTKKLKDHSDRKTAMPVESLQKVPAKPSRSENSHVKKRARDVAPSSVGKGLSSNIRSNDALFGSMKGSSRNVNPTQQSRFTRVKRNTRWEDLKSRKDKQGDNQPHMMGSEVPQEKKRKRSRPKKKK